MPARRYFISGRVQGVFFRASTRAEARRLGVDGWVRNLADSRVEVLAGTSRAEALAELGAWLRQGPPDAVVAAVEEQLVTEPVPTGFEIR